MARIFVLYAILLVALGHASPLRADALVLTPDLSRVELGSHLEYLEDGAGQLSLDQVRTTSSGWRKSEQEVLSFGYTAATYWVRFDLAQGVDLTPDPVLTKTPAQPLLYLLEIAYPVLDQVDVHVFQDHEPVAHYHMGDRLPYAQRPVDNPNFVVPLEVHPASTTTIYLRVQSSSSVQVPLTLYQDLDLVEANYDRGVLQALFYGAMFVMVIYNLLVFLAIRDISYFYYVMTVISISILLAGIEGLTFKYLWPESAWLNDSILVVALSGTVIFSALFFRSFLAIPQTRPRLSKVLLIFAMLTALTAASAFFLPYRPTMLTTILLAVGAILVGFWAGIVRWRDGFHAAKYLNIAWSCVLVAGLLLALNKLGFLPRNGFTENVGQIGTGFQTLLLSFALAHHMNHERKMREQAQQESVAAQQELLDQQVRANEDLDRMVRQRTEELELANSKLKQISATDGLTNLLNRRAFEELFQIEYKRAYREKRALAVLMIDLDHFKQINDRYGHPFGDLCLVQTSHAILANIRRPPDIAGRYGGEEFIVLLPNTDTEGAVHVARSILATLARTEIQDGAQSITVAASIGVAAHVPDDQSDRARLLKEADQSLYVAKANGRNRVEWHTQGFPGDEEPGQLEGKQCP